MSPGTPFDPRRRLLLGTACVAALTAVAPAVRAQGEGPARILVGFPAGGSLDALARLLADKLKDELKRPVLVENRPGAGGRLVVEALKAAAPDGSTVMLGPDALAVIYPHTLSRLSYDPHRDMVPISTVVDFQFALAVGSKSPNRSLAEYRQWASANPQQVSFGYPGLGGGHHFLGQMIGKAFGMPVVDVPFQGAAPMMNDLIGGQISAGLEVLGGMVEMHRSGRVRILATSGTTRSPQLPDVPSVTEFGVAGISGFHALWAPPKTPAAPVAAWNQALARVVALPEVQQRLLAVGYEPRTGSPEALTRRMVDDSARWAPVIKATGFRAD